MARQNHADEYEHMVTCFLCRSEFQFGPHRYAGKPIKAWDMMVCEGCLSANWDGIVPRTYPHLVAHLKARSIALTTNANGWIDWPS
jgi:hypothetical protein